MAKSDYKITKIKMTNAGITSPAGEFGPGDRGAFNYIPTHTSNPFDSYDYVARWRQYTHLYETSWEARKIIRIPIEDALRKKWTTEGIPEEMTSKIEQRLQELQFVRVLSRSMMLERLLGGCLTFMGIEGVKDEPAKPYNPKQGEKLRFLNAIPVSRISRATWDTDPLSENYMRPRQYLINGIMIDVSRCLVWDGDPLFDPSDFYLTNYRANPAGFGPSKLATLWDDIVKAVGTRQAAYQLIKTNNAIIMAIKDLQDLAGTDPGKKQLQVLKQVANQLSLYKAAIVDGEKVDIQQSSASFGSVPELIITFIQILSAASDIPATRFLGQAPGGLHATGDSDLENYYNMLDSLQTQRIEPQLRRIYDVIGYEIFPSWAKVREDLEFSFPPLWNETALEESTRHTNEIDNVTKLLDLGLLGNEKALEELNSRGVLSIELHEDDLQLLEEADNLMGNEEELTPPVSEAIARLRNVKKYSNADGATKNNVAMGKEIKHFTMHGLGFTIESPKGSIRKGVDPDGTPWETVLPEDYGYVDGTKGMDGDELDIYIGPTPNSELVFVVDQKDFRATTNRFDEHKIILGATNMKEAREIYIAGFSDNRGADRIMAITPVPMKEFVQWTKGDTVIPFRDYYGHKTRFVFDSPSTAINISNGKVEDK